MGLENPVHIIFILAIVLLLFGAKRLPEMGRGLGDGLRGFKEAMSGDGPADPATFAHNALPAAPQLNTSVATEAPAPAATALATPVGAGVGTDQD